MRKWFKGLSSYDQIHLISVAMVCGTGAFSLLLLLLALIIAESKGLNQ